MTDEELDELRPSTFAIAYRVNVIKSSLPAVITKAYSDPAVVKAQPFAPQLLKAVQNGVPRPVSPVYPQISEAIYKNVYSALSSGTSPQAALSKAQTQINSALKTF